MSVKPSQDSTSTEDRYTRDQIVEALSAMSAADTARVVKAAKWFSGRAEMPWEDLSQEAVLRAMDTRTCARGTPVVAFLCGIMRSIASEPARAREKARRECGLQVEYKGTYGEEGLPEPWDGDPSTEDTALSRVMHARQLEKVAVCLKGDEQLQLLVEAEFEGFRGKELEQLFSTDTKGIAALKKRLARTLRSAFPGGVQL